MCFGEVFACFFRSKIIRAEAGGGTGANPWGSTYESAVKEETGD